jgi:hypothetical protein
MNYTVHSLDQGQKQYSWHSRAAHLGLQRVERHLRQQLCTVALQQAVKLPLATGACLNL